MLPFFVFFRHFLIFFTSLMLRLVKLIEAFCKTFGLFKSYMFWYSKNTQIYFSCHNFFQVFRVFQSLVSGNIPKGFDNILLPYF